MALTPCPRCRRHLLEHTRDCPFCGKTRFLKPAMLLLAGTGFMTLLNACYGPPPRAMQNMNAPDDASNTGQNQGQNQASNKPTRSGDASR